MSRERTNYKLNLPRGFKPSVDAIVPVGTILHGADSGAQYIVKSSRLDDETVELNVNGEGTCSTDEFKEEAQLDKLAFSLRRKQIIEESKPSEEDEEMVEVRQPTDMNINGRRPIYWYEVGTVVLGTLITGLAVGISAIWRQTMVNEAIAKGMPVAFSNGGAWLAGQIAIAFLFGIGIWQVVKLFKGE